MDFRFQLTCGSFLLMPRGPTAAALLPSNVKPYFRRDIKLCFRRPRVHFHQGRFFFFKSLLRLFRHGGLVCRYLTSLLRLCRMGGGRLIVCSRFFCVLFARCYFGHIYCFLYHISLLSFLNMLLSRLFRMGESDYLDDNPMKKHFSGKEISIFSFILRWNVRL